MSDGCRLALREGVWSTYMGPSPCCQDLAGVKMMCRTSQAVIEGEEEEDTVIPPPPPSSAR